ncbi:hypothetical protein QE152_g27815 [Popillia japonica]|uniref:Uncharacterized protein n=1 Tax=Popillia japonica TaxID=7064 RepID=A0AAW1JKY8_POPJA
MQHRIFAYDTFAKNGESVITTFQYPPQWRGSKPQYNPEMGADVEDNREYCKEQAARPCKNSENAQKHRRNERGNEQEPKSICTATCTRVGS